MSGVERLRFLAGDESGLRVGAGFGEQGQRCGSAFDGARFDAVRAVAHAMRMAVENPQRDQAFAGTDAGQWRVLQVAHQRREQEPQPALPLAVGTSQRCFSRRSRRDQTGGSGDGPKIAASYLRYSSDQQDEKSIADQQRMCHERTASDGMEIAPEFEFHDDAVSGTKLRRAGLDRLLAAAKRRSFQVLYFDNLSRLARESVITMPMLKELVHVHQVRVISLTEGIDTNRQGWEINAVFASLHHEQFIKDLSANVLRGQAETVLAGYSVGDYRFGYKSQPAPDGAMIGRGRNAKRRMVYVVDPMQADWVRRRFVWFVSEQRTIGWIVHELNRQRVPKDHRSQKPDWRHPNVLSILRSPKYVGRWPWGRRQNVRNPLTGLVSQEERPEEDCQQWVRECPELRIVEDQVFDAAQAQLDENERQWGAHRGSRGRLCGSDGRQGRRHLLPGIVECGVCSRVLHVGGAHGKYLFCPGYRNGICTCGTTLRRDRAERMILTAISERILQRPEWRAAISEEVVAAWKRFNERRPGELQQLQTELAAVEKRIRRLVDQVEESDQPDPAINRRLAERRKEQAALSHKIKDLAAPTPTRQTPPTIDWVDEQLKVLGERLRGPSAAAAEALRQLPTGSIVVHEHRVGNERRQTLRGTMSIEVGGFVGTILGESSQSDDRPALPPPTVEQITLDFREPSVRDRQAGEAWALYVAGQSNLAIAKALNLLPSRVTLVLQHAAARRGLPPLDGRERRAHQYDEDNPAPYRRLAEEIKRLADEGLLLQVIATRQNVNIATVRRTADENLPTIKPDASAFRLMKSAAGR